MMLRVVVWPVGFIVLAKGAKKIFFWTELLTNSAYAGLVWIGVQLFGLPGTGIGRPGHGDLGTYIIYPKGQVVASGYSPNAIDFGLKDGSVEA